MSGRPFRVPSRIWLRCFIAAMIAIPYQVRAEPMKEFINSCVYGTLAGTLVGVASLAFTAQPGENLRGIARGASLGLYAGILLGAYVVYVVPNQGEDPAVPPAEEEAPPPEEGASLEMPHVAPLVSSRGVDGAVLNFSMTF